jgi:phytoene synthase
MTPDDYCQHKAVASGSSFYYAFMVLEPPRRQAVTALCAFCREVDGIVKECLDPNLARIKLAWWHSEVDALYAGRAEHPVTRALTVSIRNFSLPQEQLHEVIDGIEMDLQQVRYPDFKTLHLYCYRVASVVSLLTAEIFGYSNRHTLKYAHDLGLALQLTNIIRNVGEDARRGGIYLPLDELARFGVNEIDLLQARYSEGFRDLMKFQAERANSTYSRALDQLPREDRKAQMAGLIMAAIYRTLLDEIAHDGYRVLNQRIVLTPLRKLWIASKTWIRG